MSDENSRFDKVDERARAIASVTLLEHAMSLLAAAAREAPRQMHIDKDMSNAKRYIESAQSCLLPIADGTAPRRYGSREGGQNAG